MPTRFLAPILAVLVASTLGCGGTLEFAVDSDAVKRSAAREGARPESAEEAREDCERAIATHAQAADGYRLWGNITAMWAIALAHGAAVSLVGYSTTEEARAVFAKDPETLWFSAASSLLAGGLGVASVSLHAAKEDRLAQAVAADRVRQDSSASTAALVHGCPIPK